MIYDGLDNAAVERTLDEQFDRIKDVTTAGEAWADAPGGVVEEFCEGVSEDDPMTRSTNTEQ
jgi:hypothetical protein